MSFLINVGDLFASKVLDEAEGALLGFERSIHYENLRQVEDETGIRMERRQEVEGKGYRMSRNWGDEG